MRNVMDVPFGAFLGLMGWPHPSHAGTLWKDWLLSEGWTPAPALDGHRQAVEEAWQEALAEAKAGVLEQVRETWPILGRWADSMDWLQSCGRGDVVAVMSLHTGAILSHSCLGWRDDYRDEGGLLWNYDFVIASLSPPSPTGPREWREVRADASGCILDRRGQPTTKVLVRPEVGGDERDGILARWQATMGEALREVPPVRTLLVERAPTDWDVYAADMVRVDAALREDRLEDAIE